MLMLTFHTNLFARPESGIENTSLFLRGIELTTLNAEGGGPPLFQASLPLSFEEIQQRLLKIPRMDIEPDGYFLIAGGEAEGARWQIDGHLFEYNGLMHRVEMHGRCSEATFDQLLSCCGWPEASLVFELVQEGVTLDEENFRRWAVT
jgi:hypothetical protein